MHSGHIERSDDGSSAFAAPVANLAKQPSWGDMGAKPRAVENPLYSGSAAPEVSTSTFGFPL